MKIRRAKSLSVFIAFLSLLVGASDAAAMGSGNPYMDAQTGLSYQIWQPLPNSLKGVKLSTFKLLDCGANQEQWLAAAYGRKISIQLLETDAAAKCSNPGVGKLVTIASINGRKASIVVFCDPSNTKLTRSCSTSDMKKYGGYAMWSTLPTKLLHATSIEVLVSGLTYSDLMNICTGMRPVSKG